MKLKQCKKIRCKTCIATEIKKRLNKICKRCRKAGAGIGALLLLGVVLSGCSVPQKRWEYPAFTIIKASKGDVQDACYSPKGKMDNGSPHVKARLACCWLPGQKEIWVSEWYPGCLVHELCHQQGLDIKICDEKYRWDK